MATKREIELRRAKILEDTYEMCKKILELLEKNTKVNKSAKSTTNK